MWNHSNAFGSGHKSGDLVDKAASPAGSAGDSASTAASSERSEAEVETWMILEYCDKGSLQVRVIEDSARSVGYRLQHSEAGCGMWMFPLRFAKSVHSQA